MSYGFNSGRRNMDEEQALLFSTRDFRMKIQHRASESADKMQTSPNSALRHNKVKKKEQHLGSITPVVPSTDS
jgi:hypothetical protein